MGPSRVGAGSTSAGPSGEEAKQSKRGSPPSDKWTRPLTRVPHVARDLLAGYLSPGHQAVTPTSTAPHQQYRPITMDITPTTRSCPHPQTPQTHTHTHAHTRPTYTTVSVQKMLQGLQLPAWAM